MTRGERPIKLGDIGVPNLGVTVLYELINSRTDALCERAYLPWLDMELKMKEYGIPLYSLETFHPLLDFDIIGFTIPYETLYTNVLNALSLASIPLHSSDRNEKHPLIIAGGHSAFNPEPMSDFIDVFVIGEGEEIIHDLLDTYTQWKRSGVNRLELLTTLQQIKGIYVPSLYNVTYNPDNSVKSVLPI